MFSSKTSYKEFFGALLKIVVRKNILLNNVVDATIILQEKCIK